MGDREDWAMNRATLWNETMDNLHKVGLPLLGAAACGQAGGADAGKPNLASEPISIAKIQLQIDDLKAD